MLCCSTIAWNEPYTCEVALEPSLAPGSKHAAIHQTILHSGVDPLWQAEIARSNMWACPAWSRQRQPAGTGTACGLAQNRLLLLAKTAVRSRNGRKMRTSYGTVYDQHNALQNTAKPLRPPISLQETRNPKRCRGFKKSGGESVKGFLNGDWGFALIKSVLAARAWCQSSGQKMFGDL